MTFNRALYEEVAALPSPGQSFFGGPYDGDAWILWREIAATSSDGRPCRLWVKRLPAQFFRLTTGDVEITTGSGTEMAELMLALATAFAGGMVGIALSPRRAE